MALSDYLTNLGVNESSLNDSICSIMPSKFFHNSNVVRSSIVITNCEFSPYSSTFFWNIS